MEKNSLRAGKATGKQVKTQLLSKGVLQSGALRTQKQLQVTLEPRSLRACQSFLEMLDELILLHGP